MLWIKVDPGHCHNLQEVATSAILLAWKLDVVVEVTFNGIDLYIDARDTVESVVDNFDQQWENSTFHGEPRHKLDL